MRKSREQQGKVSSACCLTHPSTGSTLPAQGCASSHSSLLSKPLDAPETVKPSDQIWTLTSDSQIVQLVFLTSVQSNASTFKPIFSLEFAWPTVAMGVKSEFQNWFLLFLFNSSTQSTGKSPISLAKSILRNLLTENCLRHWQIRFDHTGITELYPESQ